MPDMTPPKAPVNPARAEATGDKTTTPDKEQRFASMTEHLRHLFGLGESADMTNKVVGGKAKSVDEVVDEAVGTAPGNHADY